MVNECQIKKASLYGVFQDPLILLISSDHPTVRTCANFEELERQQQMLDVYRTRCLFVCGDPVTFEQIMLKRDAERKAFTEMASLKQAETMEKIVGKSAEQFLSTSIFLMLVVLQGV